VSVAAESAVRAWVNALPITGPGNPLSRGAYLHEQRSPADGAYAVLSRTSEGVTNVVAENDGALSIARMQCLVYAGTEPAAELAAAALRSAIEKLAGSPQPCGTTGVTVLVTDNLLGPFLVPHYGATGEQFCFQINADFLLRQ
jgi:hypothetical protein